MARRRVNTRFIAILGAVAVLLGGGVWYTRRVLNRTHPEQYIAAAKQAEATHRWGEAVSNMQSAVGASPRDPQLLTELGDDLNQYGQENLEAVRRQQDLAAWNSALEIEPRYAPAIKSLMNYYRRAWEGQPSAYAFRNARDQAAQFLRVAPNDPDAAAVASFLYTMTIRGSVQGLETDPAEIQQAETELAALSRKNPADADPPFCLAELAVHRGAEIVGEGNDTQQPEATQQFQLAGKIMAAALAGQEKNALMHFDAAAIYTMLAQSDWSSADVKAKNQAAADKEMQKAMDLVQPTDKDFERISVSAAAMYIASGNPDKAHAIVERLLKEQGSDPETVYEVAQLLRTMPDLRQGAIQTLEQSLAAESQTAEITLRRYRLLAPLVDLQISELADAKDETVKDRLKAQITQNIGRMENANIDAMLVVSDKARLDRTIGDNVSAVQVLTAGMASDARIGDSPDLMWMLAQAYNDTNEREQALDFCNRVVVRSPNFLPARKMLVQLLSGTKTEEARRQISQHLNFLSRAEPGDAETIRLQMLQLDPAADGDQIKALYGKLPEKTTADMSAKAMVALQQMSDQSFSVPEAIRLFEKAIAIDPKDPGLVIGLTQVYARFDRRADAIAAVEKGLASMPDNEDLQLMLKQLENAPDSELQKLKQDMDSRTADPIDREIVLARDALNAADMAGAQKHLDAAMKIAPDNEKVLGLAFEIYLRSQQWDKANGVAQKLAADNTDKAHGLLYQFSLAGARGDVQRQIAIGVQLTTDLPQFAMSYFCLASAYQAAGQYEQAIGNYDTALEKKGVDRDAEDWLKKKIECLYKVNRPDQALQSIQEGRRRYPLDDDFLIMQIRHEADHGDAQAAVNDLIDLQHLHPDQPGVYLDLASAEMQLAISKLRNGNAADAAVTADTARDLMKAAVKVFPDDSEMYQKLSSILRYSGDLKGAEQALEDLKSRPAYRNKATPDFLLGQFYLGTQQPEKAETAYASALALANGDEKPMIQVQLAQVLSGERKFDQALGALSVANADNKLVREERVNVLVMAGRIADAGNEIQKIGASNPAEKSQLEEGWAQLELNADHREAAASHLANALAADPNNAQALILRAQLRQLQSPPDLDGAMADLNAAHQLKPSDVSLLEVLAQVDEKRQDFVESSKALELALRLSPADATIRNRLAYNYAHYAPVQEDKALQVLQDGLSQPGGDTNADLFNNIANVYQEMNKTDEALQTITQALSRIPNSLVLIQSYLRLNLHAQQYQSVIDAASTLIRQRPDLWWAWQYRGQARARLGDKDEAMTDMIQALAVAQSTRDPAAPASVVEAMSRDVDAKRAIQLVQGQLSKGPEWTYMLILLYHQQGQDDEAVKLLEPMMAAAKDLPAANRATRLQLAGSIYTTAQPKPYAEKAYETYKELLKINPNDVQSLNNLACVCADDFVPPKVEEGLAAIQKAMDTLTSMGTSDPLVEDTYGWLLILEGRTAEGMDVIRKAVGRMEFPEAYYHLAEGSLRLDDPQEAQRLATLAMKAITKAQDLNQPVSVQTKARLNDLNARILDSLRLRTSNSVQ